MIPELDGRLQAALAAAFPERQGLTIGPLASLTAGWESELHAFDLRWVEAGQARTEPLVLRLHAGAEAHVKTQHEFQGLRRLAAAGYPVPRAVWAFGPKSALGRPAMLLERIEGEVMWARLDRAAPAEAGALIDLFGRLFVQLHRLEWEPFAEGRAREPARAWAAGGPAAPYAFVDHWLAEAGQVQAAHPDSGLEATVDWLRAGRDRVPCARPAVVHRDFHPANILVRPEGGAAVIDWTGLGVTDPRSDVAWTLLLARMFAGPGVREMLLGAYERHAGAPLAELDWFEVAACARRFFEVLQTLAAGDAATGRRPGAQAVMQAQTGALRPAYEFFRATTGLRLPRVEALFGG
jgi:aminoglycoside phosphotransferase (APT) family kinase protein